MHNKPATASRGSWLRKLFGSNKHANENQT
jgi:hypothetical protein